MKKIKIKRKIYLNNPIKKIKKGKITKKQIEANLRF